jgi:hypothetical protein
MSTPVSRLSGVMSPVLTPFNGDGGFSGVVISNEWFRMIAGAGYSLSRL